MRYELLVARPEAGAADEAERRSQASADRLLTGPDWYRHAVFYEVNVRSFTYYRQLLAFRRGHAVPTKQRPARRRIRWPAP